MSIAENLLNAAAREFIPTFAAPRNESTSDLAASRKPAEITSVTVNEDVCLDSRESVGKKKKTKDERSAPRKRRHQRGRSGDAAADYMLSSKSIKKQEKDLDDISYESLSWRESPSHHKSKSDGNILSWFDEIKQRRVSRYRKELDLYGDLPHDEAAQLNLVFSQPQEWVFGSNIADGKGLPSLEDTEYLAEKLERKKWQNWAQSAAEMERKRRIQVLQELDAEQEIERQRRRRWAIKAIEKEKAERISAQFLSSLSSTNWFNETITAYHEDYELVCPYFKLGCRVSCRRGTIEKHLKKCRFALEMIDAPLPEISGGYEVVCPNSVLGCVYIGSLDALHQHLTVCSFSGLTVQQEIEERRLLKQHVIMQQEEERARRVRFDDNVVVAKRPKSGDSTTDIPPVVCQPTQAIFGSTSEPSESHIQSSEDVSDTEGKFMTLGADVDSSENSDGGGGRPRSLSRKKALLQSLLEEQTKSVIHSLHREAEAFYAAALIHRAARFKMQEQVIEILRTATQGLWSFADILPFGSHATGLSSLSSDLDLVVCFSDQYKSLPSVTGVVPLLQNLAECIQRQASEVFVIRKVLLHSAVPIIKADVLKSGLIARGLVREGANPAGIMLNIEKMAGMSSALKAPEVSWQKPSADATSYGARSLANDDIFLSVDISIDGPLHSGLATTEFVRSMLKASPILAPAVCVLKEFFKSKGLADPYTGGLSSYGIFLLVLLLYQRQNRLLFSSTATPSPKSLSSSPGRTIGRSFSFGDEEVGLKRNTPVLKLFGSADNCKKDTEGNIANIPRDRSMSTPDAQSWAKSEEVDKSGAASSNFDPCNSSLSGSNTEAQHECSVSIKKTQLQEQRPHQLDDLTGHMSSILSPLPRQAQSSLITPTSRLYSASPPVSSGRGRQASSFYHGNNGWKKVQQQMDFGSRVADKLLGVKHGSSKRRNSKTALSKFALEYCSSDSINTPNTPNSSFNNGSHNLDKCGDEIPDPLRNVARVNSIEGTSVRLAKNPTTEGTDLGNLLIDFLEFYSEGWENEKVGFSVRDGGFKFDLVNSAGTPSHPQADDPFVIEDPVNVMNNVAKSCYNVAGVMRCIQDSYGKYRACVVKPGSANGGMSPRVRSPRRHVASQSTSGDSGTAAAELLPVLLETDEEGDQEMMAKGPVFINPVPSGKEDVLPELTQLNIDNDRSSNSSPVHKEEENSQKIFSKTSVRLNIRTRATNYMQQYTRGPTNSPVNPTKRLDPIQSIVFEIFGLPVIIPKEAMSSVQSSS